MSVKITQLEAENVKRIKAVSLTPAQNGLTIIGGDNNQGKTSVLDALAWALGGNRFKPSNAHRDGSMTDPELRVTLSNGLLVERKGPNSSLKVTDPSGCKSGQTILDSFVSAMALDIPKFMEATDREKANYLLQIIGVGPQLEALEKKEKSLYDTRTATGIMARQKKAHADELPEWPDVGTTPVSAAELIQKQQDILAVNGENARKRQMKDRIAQELEAARNERARLASMLAAAEDNVKHLTADLETASRDALDLYDESTAEIEESIRNIEETNAKIRQNMDKKHAIIEASELAEEYRSLSEQIDGVRKEKRDLLTGFPLPLPGLAVSEGKLTYQGQLWDGMSGSDQLKVATAIVRQLNPECGFVLLDKLEQMDSRTLKEFGDWLESEGLQAIATRVSTGDECSIIIEDGRVKGSEKKEEKEGNWKW